MAKNLIKQKKQNTRKINFLITLQAIISFILTIGEILTAMALLMVMEDKGINGNEVYYVVAGVILLLFLTYFLLNKLFGWLINKASK